jgi:uncharacterized protein DUF1707
MIYQNPGDAAGMRISDADRDRAASVLGNALAEGRLTAEEHSARLDAVFAAKTHADIAPLVRDLPGAAAALEPAAYSALEPGGGAEPGAPLTRFARSGGRPRVVAVFSGAVRKGRWCVPAELEAASVFGDVELDLRQATMSQPTASMRVFTIFGSARITVPPEMHVVDEGWALFGGREMPPDSDESAGPGAPVLRVTGVSIFGMITVRREQRAIAVG